MGVRVSLGGRYHCAYFDEEVRDLDATRLAAVVIQRTSTDPQQTGFWRTVRQAVASFRKPPPPPAIVPLPDGWNAASGMGGRHEVLFSSERRLVRVAGREHRLPDDGSTLALLVDQSSGLTGEPPVIRHSLRPPMGPLHRHDRMLDTAENLRRLREQSDSCHSAWTAAVEGDPLLRAFMQVDADR